MNAQKFYDEWKELVQLSKLINLRKKELKKILKSLENNYRPMRSPESLKREMEMAERYKNGETLQEIGDHYGLTRERVRQLINKVGVSGKSTGRYPTKEVIK
ncbi:hypothetical protein GCM10008934_02930 [Virgibacillus salarius]|uniref:sigma factor-like helix-turn-helix DNA-binding protein n=1 Tax=Virgibacillus salarius TaxID=447199 RepID=UPI0031DBFFF8